MSKTLDVNSTYLISLIRALIHGSEVPAAPEGKNDGALISIAEKQALSCMVYHALYKRGFENVDEPVKQQLKKIHMVYVQHAVMQEMEFYKVSSALEACGIDYMPLKGWYTRELYPETVLRYMGDIDILISSDYRRAAYDAMTKLGYTSADYAKYEGDTYCKAGITFEMHFSLDNEGLTDGSVYAKPFELADCTGGHCYRMHTADAYLYTVVHGMKHFMYGGTGLRTLLDIYLYIKNGDIEKSRGYIDGCAERMGVSRFLHRMERLAVTVFGEPGPFDPAKADPESIELISFLLRSGTAGSTTTLDASLLERSGRGGKGGSRASYIFRMVFPTLKTMQRRNPVLKKAPVLLPVMYVYRWLQLLFRDRDHIKNSIERYNALEDAAVDELRHIHDIAGIE